MATDRIRLRGILTGVERTDQIIKELSKMPDKLIREEIEQYYKNKAVAQKDKLNKFNVVVTFLEHLSKNFIINECISNVEFWISYSESKYNIRVKNRLHLISAYYEIPTMYSTDLRLFQSGSKITISTENHDLPEYITLAKDFEPIVLISHCRSICVNYHYWHEIVQNDYISDIV